MAWHRGSCVRGRQPTMLDRAGPPPIRSKKPLTPPPPTTNDRKWQQLLDRSTVHTGLRWLVFAGLMALYALRVFLLNGWFIVTYGLGIYLLNNFIGFLSPQVRSSFACGGSKTGVAARACVCVRMY